MLAKIPSIPRFSPAHRNPQKQRSYSTAFKMTKMYKGEIAPRTGQDMSEQNGVIESRSTGEQTSLLANGNSIVGPSSSDESRVEFNGHEPTTRQRTESAAAEHSFDSGKASSSASHSCVSTIPTSPTDVATVTAAPPVVEEASRKHVKKVAHDCYVDLAQQLSPELERAWETKIYPWLDTILLHSMDDLNYISAELVMAGVKDGGSMYPTILVMCRDLAQKESIEELVKRCSFIPKNVQRRILIFDILQCTTRSLITNAFTGRFLGRRIGIDVDDAHDANVLYANVAKILTIASDTPSVFCTIGGMLSINGKLYGLTTAHPFAALGDEGQVAPIATSGMQLWILL